MKNKENPCLISPYETSDMLLAATLQAHGLSIIATEWIDDYRCNFCFEDSKELQEIVALFWQHKLRVEPHQLHSSLKAIKTRLRSSN